MKLLIMLIFYFILMLSTLITLSSHSWMIIWMMLEINLMSFIPIIMLSKMINNHTFLFKYFIVQTISSSSFLITITLMWINDYSLNIFNTNFMEIMLSLSMILKMGLYPFHLWYIEIMLNLPWMMFFLMSTWQKIIPLTIISFFNENTIIYMTIIISSMISSIQGIYQNNLRKIFAFSSINQTSWLTINSNMSIYLMIMYMLMYMMILFSIINMLNVNNFYYINNLYLLNNYHYLMKLFLFLNILSLAGLPPFMGFITKIISIKFLIFNKMYLITSILIISSLMTLFFYLRLTYTSMILIKSKFNPLMMKKYSKDFSYKSYFFNKLNFMMIMITILSYFSLIIMTLFDLY
ncbi:NADH dehydrogenase subunit 2 (mitochondrion) [Cephus cinctus]|uniref:NADH-ubiquinone oxidoreductase chain 2 n=1 Tax=Cephus cinctus TaxID=211228 RepID=C4NCD0_CEPCN|nr:NADH dehydrogenase subunit 2 [Cephus cinctus]ACJ69685.1 NADH dehydrogenase subunit 2 [Cephus cinctus]